VADGDAALVEVGLGEAFGATALVGVEVGDGEALAVTALGVGVGTGATLGIVVGPWGDGVLGAGVVAGDRM
jgi:hypothetical protein